MSLVHQLVLIYPAGTSVAFPDLATQLSRTNLKFISGAPRVNPDEHSPRFGYPFSFPIPTLLAIARSFPGFPTA